MKRILLFGAGKSASSLIDYLVKESEKNNWQFTVCDADISVARSKTGNSKNAIAVSIDVTNDTERQQLISQASIVISLLPPGLHYIVAQDCVEFGKDLLTASYIDEQITNLKKAIEDKGMLVLCEMGLDPGIDHMSAMKMLHAIKNKNGRITSFKSHCGGLVAPESDDNPWHYKISWNARNIVLAGKDGAVYRENNHAIKIPYNSVFRNCKIVDVPGLATMSWYPNRDSLSYIKTYDLEETSTFIRTTLRYPEFCRGWNRIVNMGFTSTNDYELIKNCKTFAEWYEIKTDTSTNSDDDRETTDRIKNEFSEQVNFLSLKSNELLPENFKCSADILQSVMEKKLALHPEDHDMIVMYHEIEYEIMTGKINEKYVENSSLVVKGDNNIKTAMAKTVGLPLAIATKLILQGKITVKGLHIPTIAEIYEPVLAELEEHGIKFHSS
jgi:saccharopine dehydrogenase (NADP+, L-glutamate forming)